MRSWGPTKLKVEGISLYIQATLVLRGRELDGQRASLAAWSGRGGGKGVVAGVVLGSCRVSVDFLRHWASSKRELAHPEERLQLSRWLKETTTSRAQSMAAFSIALSLVPLALESTEHRSDMYAAGTRTGAISSLQTAAIIERACPLQPLDPGMAIQAPGLTRASFAQPAESTHVGGRRFAVCNAGRRPSRSCGVSILALEVCAKSAKKKGTRQAQKGGRDCALCTRRSSA